MRTFAAVFATTFVALMISVSAFAKVSPTVQAVGEARLKLASALIKALDTNEVCGNDAYPSEINNLVSSATTQLSPTEIANWVAKIPADSKIKADFTFRQAVDSVELSGKKVDVAALKKQLEGAKFHEFGMGVYGSQYNVTFGKPGVAVVQTMELIEKEPYWKWTESETTWDVVVIKESWGEKAKLKIGTTEYEIEPKSGEFWLVPTNIPASEIQYRTLSTSDSYCEA